MRACLFLLLYLVLLCFLPQQAQSNVYASDVRISNPDGSPFDGNFLDGTGAMVTFVLNDTASTVTVKFIDISDGSTVYTIDAGSSGRGEHSVEWDGTGAAAGARYIVSILAEQPTYSSTAYVVYRYVDTQVDPVLEIRTIFTRGVDSNNDPSSRNFGYVYASNDDPGGRLRRGVLRYRADAEFAGTDAGDPMLLSTLGSEFTGGTTGYGLTGPWHATLDYLGRVYVSAVDTGLVYRVDSNTSVPKVILSGLTKPRGLALVGQGNELTIYVAQDQMVLRAKIGTADTFSGPLDTVAILDRYVRDVLIDDAGFMYVTVRTDDGSTQGALPGAVSRYNISGPLPVTSTQFEWSLPVSGLPVGLAMNRGPSRQTNTDDILYFSIRSTSSGTDAPGIWRVDDINSPFNTSIHLWKPGDFPQARGRGDVSFNADLTVDVVGNILYFENGNEELLFLSPPSSSPTQSYTTVGIDTIRADVATSVESELAQPSEFILFQNYPNPFNPETTITFVLPRSSFVSVKVYDMVGREIATLVNDVLPSGSHAVMFRANHLSSGTYLYLMQAGQFVDRKKMVLLK